MTPAIVEALTLIQVMVLALVDDQKSVVVTGEATTIGFRIDVQANPVDIGKIIGKQGRTARSIRTILQGHSMRTKQAFSLNIIEA